MRPEADGSAVAHWVAGGVKLAAWGGARFAGEAGVEVVEGFAVTTVFEIPSVPDFSSERFPDLARLDEGQRISAIGSKQAQFLSALHQLGPSSGFSIRYCLSPSIRGSRRVRILLVGRAFAASQGAALAAAGSFRQVVEAAFPREYRLEGTFGPGSDPALDASINLRDVASIVEVLKPEELVQSWHDPAVCGFPHYYRPVAFTSAENSMITVCGALLKQQASSVTVDICLVPTGNMTAVEHGEARNWVALCERWSRDQRVEVGGGLYSRPTTIEIGPDPAARDVGTAYDQILERYSGTDRLFLYAIRIMSSDAEPLAELASVVASAALAPGAGYHLRTMARNDASFGRALAAARNCSISPAVCNDSIWKRADAPETLRRLHRMACIDELSSFFRLPIPGRAGCPGVPTDTGGVDVTAGRRTAEAEIHIGVAIEDNRVGSESIVIPLRDLTKSALVVGMPGSGKTTFCFSLLEQLWREHRVPFLVLEPAKTEYRALLTLPAFRDDLWVFTVGNERASSFRLNPFEVPDGVPVSEHISALVTCFSGAFDLWDPLPMIIEQAIRNAYEAGDWSEYELGGERQELEPPTMDTVFREALVIAGKSSYRGETAGNIKGALEARIGSLLVGPKGRCFNNRRSIPVNELLSRPVVLELDSLNENEKALLMMFVLTLVREHAKATRRSGAPLSHVMLLEEAHAVIGRADSGGASDHSNPRAVATRLFTRAIAEMRALGEGIVIADQLPTAIAPEAVKNTSVKVMHRLVSADDRSELGQAMIFDAGQVEQAATLSPGRAFIHMEGWARSRLVAEPDFKTVNQIAEPPDDRFVAGAMAPIRQRESVRLAFLPYKGCEHVCTACSPRLREEMERACRGALAQIEEEEDESGGFGTGASPTRAIEVFMERANVPVPDEAEAATGPSAAALAGQSPDCELRLGCAGVFLTEVLLQRLSERSRQGNT